ncbi:MAG: hypothetical protein QOI15_215 [Pseudonocardiales bacterium]|nr:hypothetical protein [Pseudonocardiales bacterium]
MIAASSFSDVDDAYFTPLDGASPAARYLAGPLTAGPWDERLQHGGPPNALAVTVAEEALRAESGRTDLVAMRLAADFVGPVPVGELEVRTEIRRAARSAALVEVTLVADGRTCLLARVWFVRAADTSAIAPPLGAELPVPEGRELGLDVDFGYGSSIEWRLVKGRMGTPGPAVAWACPRTDLLPAKPPLGLARVALIADTASGLSAELDWAQWSFVNVDLDVHLARPVEGDWILMDAATQLGPTGSALTRSTISDVRGGLGAGLQTLVVAPMAARG